MPSPLVIIITLLGVAESVVQFTHSTLYDQVDIFQNIPISVDQLCRSGCSLYASIPPDSATALKEAGNVVITDGDKTTTLLDISRLYDDATSQKKPYELLGKVSIKYTGTVIGAGPVLLYVFSSTGKTNVPFEVYEARTMKRKTSTARIVTILSPEPFTVGTQPTQLGNTVYAYAAGMDNAIELAGPDDCVKVFELRAMIAACSDQGSFPGFVLNVQLPLLSFYFNTDTPVEFYTRMAYSTVTGFDQFLSSPGFVGCYGNEVYRSSLYPDKIEHTVSGERVEHVTIDATLSNGEDSLVRILDVTNNRETDLWGDEAHKNSQQQITMDSQLLYITWDKARTRSQFLLRFTTASQPNAKSTTLSTTRSPSTTTITKAAGGAAFSSLLFLVFLWC